MRRGRSSSSASPYRALAHHQQAAASAALSPSSSLIRSFDVETNPGRPVRSSPLAASVIRDMPLDLLDRVRSFPLFQSAPDDFLIAIGNHLKPQINGPNDHIVTEGDDAKAMYWLVRGVVAVTSRDGEAVYAELKPGAFFGEIGVLMNMPRTATIVARTKCLLLVLKKEDLKLVIPRFPKMEQAIWEEAQERLSLLKKKANKTRPASGPTVASLQPREQQELAAAATRAPAPVQVSTGESGAIKDGAVVENPKKRKSPSPGVVDGSAGGGSAIGSGLVNIRNTLKELPLFSTLPPDILHFLGLSVQPKSYPPFTNIIRQGSSGNDIYFIVQGEAEVFHHEQLSAEPPPSIALGGGAPASLRSRPRLRAGQYFGEVASLGLSAGRTATVRSITSVECLMVPGAILDELWQRCPPGIKSEVEETARRRYSIGTRSREVDDVDMHDSQALDQARASAHRPTTPTTTLPDMSSLANFVFARPSRQHRMTSSKDDAEVMMGPKDSDPFLSVDMENLRNCRWHSLAPPVPCPPPHLDGLTTPPRRPNGSRHSPTSDTATVPIELDPTGSPPPPDARHAVRAKRAKTLVHQGPPPALHARQPETAPAATTLTDDILVHVFGYLDVGQLARLRIISRHWRHILTTCPDVCNDVDLSHYNRRVNDEVIVRAIAPFIGARAVSVDLSNCFHITDEGFSALWRSCGKNVRRWRMRSVWDVSASQILEMCENAKNLEEIDWSNCRKAGDNLLGRVVGWVVPVSTTAPAGAIANRGSNMVVVSPSSPGQPRDRGKTQKNVPAQAAPTTREDENSEEEGERLVQRQDQQQQQQQHQQHHHHYQQQQQQQQWQPPGKMRLASAVAAGPNLVVGCPKLTKLNLSYCKHITDRSMAHLAAHASNRLQSLILTRCTSITDVGFQAWAASKFERLTRLCLADCTYLTDSSMVALANAAKNLTHLDLSFCCALSDTSTEVVALSLPRLRELRMAFCGSAVSDGTLATIALHLDDLEGLSVRGCVRVTGRGLESVLEGCARLKRVDISQCRNLESWLRSGSLRKWGFHDGMMSLPPPPGLPYDGRGGAGRALGSAPAQGSSGAATFAPPALLPRPHLGGLRGRRAGRQPVRFIVEKGTQGLR